MRWEKKKKKKKSNRFDLLIDSLNIEFSKIPNDINLLQSDPKGKELFIFAIKRIFEIQSFKQLFLKYYIPASQKSAADVLNEIQKSKNKNLIVLTQEDLKENLYETVRLGYVGLYHKYENYRNELIDKAEDLFGDVNQDNTSLKLKEFSERVFNFKIRNPNYSKTIERINWICNCVKHTDGYPKRYPRPEGFETLHENQKLELDKDDFARDASAMADLYPFILNIVFKIAGYKIFSEKDSYPISNEYKDVALEKKFELEKINAKCIIINMIESLKQK
jgi:hypothetical protein